LGRSNFEVAVVGAGPYGLATAAKLNAAGIDTVVFGQPMAFWRGHMPKGMRLRSTWHASDIGDRTGPHALAAFAAERNMAPRDQLPLETFVAYGTWFQERAVPHLDPRQVNDIAAADGAFVLTLADGETVRVGRVVIATGLQHQEFRPAPFDRLPAQLVSHSSDHDDLAPFGGRRVAVVGRGQSACESAALLADAGAKVELVARGQIHWLGSEHPKVEREPGDRPYTLQTARSGVGPFPLCWVNELPGVLHAAPAAVRRQVNARSLRAGATAWLKPRFAGVTLSTGRTILAAIAVGDRVRLHLDDGPRTFDHVLLGTGYRIDVAKLGFLRPDLVDRIARDAGAPVLGWGFESSVPGLHFVGASAVKSYGPLLRFVAGSGYAAREVARVIAAARGARRGSVRVTAGGGRVRSLAAANQPRSSP
jgi:cation diffusion facilitator CzcD-associated flavoprotein CzcO